ncbi:MAG: UDP-N-acetylmuramoyl-L-alanyl-D-glutamate--2,6-diaminopimelate ligase [Clostridia bacterium]|nr:UDP-N-acetylmuramoyl-L-alanyl-D-glutamate--2,6-diaminopimelate ligase [Clostridia bacterium]
MKLSEVLKGVSYECGNFTDTDIKDIAYDSRKTGEGIIFVCLVGVNADGHKYALSAYENGSRVFLCEKDVDLPVDAVIIKVEDTRAALASVSCNFFRHPSKELALIGITGTKGKTTTAHIVKFVLESGGIKTGIIGTVGASFGDTVLPTVNTTPESYELQRMLRLMVDGGCKACVMEVSSLGLKFHRTDGLHFAYGVFTNLYPDHIGTNEHESFEEYAFWKTQLFPMCEKAIINADDAFSKTVIENCKGQVITYGYSESADYILGSYEKVKEGNILGVDFEVKTKKADRKFTVALPGEINASNSLVAVALGDGFGVSDEDISKGLKSVFVKGRCELVRADEDVTVIIDYAHNGVSLKSIIETASEYEHNRIITLFGSVGGRTECRREELGMVSGAMSDFTVITSDDPNFEDPQKIGEEIAFYCEKAGGKGKYVIIPDRGEAVNYAVKMAQKGDIIILAGKGHEEYMKIKGEKVPFSEKTEVIKAFKEKKEGTV